MEADLWRVLRNRNLSFKFRRQHAIEFFIIDFYCAEVKLCIEIDGESLVNRADKNTTQLELNISNHLDAR